MMDSVEFLSKSLLIGVLATFFMDLGAIVGTRLGLVNKPNQGLLGRWLIELKAGRWRRPSSDIRIVPARKNEAILGLITHYLIGVILAGFFLMLKSQADLPDGWGPPILFGLMTNAFPWFLMFPSMGFGLLGLAAAAPSKLWRTSFVNHLVYGVGLWAGAALFGRI